MQIVYVVLMMVTCIVALLRGDNATVRGTFVVVYNWCACMLVVLVSDDRAPVLFFLIIDAMSAAIVLRSESTALRMLGASYIGQCIMHLLFAVRGGDPYYYWQVLTVLGYGQLVLLVVMAFLTPPHREASHELC